MQKIKVYHFNNGSGGGTYSVIKNLLQFSDSIVIENHVIYTINKKLIRDFLLPKTFGALSQQVFNYSPEWNFYYTCRQLKRLLTDDAVIAAHDWLELGMASNLGLQNSLVHFVHGNYDYYYNLSRRHEKATDQFIAVSPVIYNKLVLQIPHRRGDINYRRFPVPEIFAAKNNNKALRVFYCVRSLLDDNKQFKILPLINNELRRRNINVEWTIIGEGVNENEVKRVMQQQMGIDFFSSLPNEDVLKLLPAQDLLVLPSLEEGFPVIVAETMKAGIVPLVTNWEDATLELIIQNKTGYYFAAGDVNAYADTIELLNSNRALLHQLSCRCLQKANELFDPYENTKRIEEVILRAYHSGNKQKKAYRVYGSRLDKTWMPNLITKAIRSI